MVKDYKQLINSSPADQLIEDMKGKPTYVPVKNSKNDEKNKLPTQAVFETKKEFSDNKEIYEDPYDYVLSVNASLLENLTGTSIEEIKSQKTAYGFNYIIYKYLKPVKTPTDGNIVVYRTDFTFYSKITHAGIYREIKTNPSLIGAVESKVSLFIKRNFVFLHDPFFLPDSNGHIAEFYQIREPKIKLNRPLNVNSGNRTYINGAGYLAFNDTEENKIIRTYISESDTNKVFAAIKTIKPLPYIVEFKGVCYDYAFGKVARTYFQANFPIYLEGQSHIVLKNNFTATTLPKKGDLVAYYIELNDMPVHFGVYLSDDKVESKWGKGYPSKHPVFYAPAMYGNYVKFFRLNEDLTPQTFVEKLRNQSSLSSSRTDIVNNY